MIGLEYILEITGKSHSELAENLGIQRQNINQWIKGKSKIPKKYIPLLSDMFGISAEYLQKNLDEVDKLIIQKEKLKRELKPNIISYDLRLNVRGEADIIEKPIYDAEVMNDLEFEIKRAQIIEDFREVAGNIHTDIELQMLEQVALLFKEHNNKKILNFTIDAVSHYYNVLPDWVGDYDVDDFVEEFLELAKKYDK